MKKLFILIIALLPTILNAYPTPLEIRMIEEFVPEEYQADVFYLMMEKGAEELTTTMFLRLMYIESSFDPNAIREENNGSRSIGFCQLNSSCQEWFEEKFHNTSFDPYNPSHNLSVSVNYLEYLYDRFGDWPTVFVAYNCGEGNVMRGTIPLSSFQYSEAIMIGRVSPDSYLYEKMLYFEERVSQLKNEVYLVNRSNI